MVLRQPVICIEENRNWIPTSHCVQKSILPRGNAVYKTIS